ncbi:MAG TPA: hypothetical protein VJM12_01650 [Pyrinomonadaceae bacterium]|nr:hypothetical protein [Pyrinomonadaceae bacterium]
MPTSLAAADGAATVTGGGTFSVGQDKNGHFNFNAITHANGSVTGHLSLRNPEEVPNQDVDGNGELGSEALPDGAEVRAELDSVNISGNRVALSGVITSANVQRYVGLRMILTIEDNGEGSAAEPDKITWGFYQRIVPRLVADAENPDAGAFAVGERFLATDAERPEEGAFLVGKSDFDSQSFPLSSFSLTNINGGNIQIQK